MDDLLTVNQVAEILGILPRSVHTAIAEDRLPATKLSPRVMLIRRADAEAYKVAKKHAGGRPRRTADKDT